MRLPWCVPGIAGINCFVGSNLSAFGTLVPSQAGLATSATAVAPALESATLVLLTAEGPNPWYVTALRMSYGINGAIMPLSRQARR